MNKDALPFLAMLLVVFVVFSLLAAGTANSSRRDRYNKEPVEVETNSIGCKKYIFKESAFWRCPRELDIDSIETTETRNIGKSLYTETTIEPVIKD